MNVVTDRRVLSVWHCDIKRQVSKYTAWKHYKCCHFLRGYGFEQLRVSGRGIKQHAVNLAIQCFCQSTSSITRKLISEKKMEKWQGWLSSESTQPLTLQPPLWLSTELNFIYIQRSFQRFDPRQALIRRGKINKEPKRFELHPNLCLINGSLSL